MRRKTPRFWTFLLVIAVVAANTPVAYAAAKHAVHQAAIHEPDYQARMGRWDVTAYQSPVRSVHAAVLHTGEVLLAAGSGNNKTDGQARSFKSVLWNPTAGTFTSVNTPWDLFCAGHSFLPDGSVLVAGGTKGYEDLTGPTKIPFKGLRDSYVFDPVARTYTRAGRMHVGRWYPTLLTLGSGNVLAVAGLGEDGKEVPGTTEIFDARTREWTRRDDLKQWFPTYPHLFLLRDGRIFYSGQGAGYASDKHQPAVWDLRDNNYRRVSGLPDAAQRDQGASVLLPPAQDQKVVTMGGGPPGGDLTAPATASVALADLTADRPRYVPGQSLPTPKRYVSAVILPDGNVLETGGSRLYRADMVLEASLYDPQRGTFRPVAAPAIGRTYHSEAILLPDGRVATLGSNPLKDNAFEMRIEIYSPPYLFQGRRPEIAEAPSEARRGGSYLVRTRQAAPIKAFNLLRPSSVTHSLDTDQRSIALDFRTTRTGFRVSMPSNPNLAPPGWYMLFALDAKGRPSNGWWVHLS